MKEGRPTKFSKKMVKKALEYVSSCVDDIGFDDKGKPYTASVNLPKAEGLAIYLGVSRDTLYEWAKKHPEFSDILEAINANQVEKLINQGLAGNYNATIAKLVLAKHGYKDTASVELTKPQFIFDNESDKTEFEELVGKVEQLPTETKGGGESGKSV